MEPLASKIRPETLDEFIGHEHLVGKGNTSTRQSAGPLRVAIEKKELFPFILWGPPGCGKTTLARIYANALGADFYELSAVDSGKDDIKRVLGTSGTVNRLQFTEKPRILFVDEIHRFNKAQQDFLLPFVERGDITFIGATTENPSFGVISPLLSRSRIFVLNELSEPEMEKVIARAAKQMSAEGGSTSGGKVPKPARDWLVQMAGGDARQAIGVLETAYRLYSKISLETLKAAVQSKHIRYDKKGEEHYNVISAFIKSMRASQPDAALYYLARMVEAGEDPKFIARRMVIFASEDIGLAQPTALVVANAVFRAVETIGYPEATINLAHGAAYLAQCKKDRRAYDAVFSALEDVRKFSALSVPLKLRNAPTKLMKDLKYGKGYEKYDTESYLPEKLRKRKYLK
ncbi:AAA family ATPase [Candidatus Kaiserbacteria bacterium RIFCSPHIGHO2_02_FULL_49_16]|uniref:Stalled replication fork rescue ATPase n=2 Tax=Parcubacteria group TaxID=1794811 RepID=A0A0G1WFA9_9BACT|nr:MAG: Stalled replication fork rescue ATPase [Candidatus Magasanikbacteria bacterium GW2011_GWA2_50_22]OGG58716.1 MAG: AAA family ATPase [Candidatus Kaiserbacteria bacterium RIFCSPHIGHO2_02_FULL_49_16]